MEIKKIRGSKKLNTKPVRIRSRTLQLQSSVGIDFGTTRNIHEVAAATTANPA